MQINMIMAYFERKGLCTAKPLFKLCINFKNVFKRYRIVQCQVLLIRGDIGQRRMCKWNILFYWRELQGATVG